MLNRGDEEENIEKGVRSKSLGLIEIYEGAIHWVNLVRKRMQTENWYYIKYGVPYPRLQPDSPHVRIKSVRIRTSPLFGQVVDLRWKGKDSGLGIISRLNSDISIKHPIMTQLNCDVKIRAHGNHECWIISTENDPLTAELWSCYQAIARHLLATSIPS